MKQALQNDVDTIEHGVNAESTERFHRATELYVRERVIVESAPQSVGAYGLWERCE